MRPGDGSVGSINRDYTDKNVLFYDLPPIPIVFTRRMSIFEFIVEMTKALVWPTSLLMCVLLFRRQINKALSILTRVKYQGVEMEFAHEISGLSAEVLSPRPLMRDEEMSNLRRKLLTVAARTPRVAVIEAWRLVENQLVDKAQQLQLSVPPAVWTTPLMLSYYMSEEGIISPSQDDLINSLRALQKTAARDDSRPIKLDDAIKYIDLSLDLAASLKLSSSAQAGFDGKG